MKMSPIIDWIATGNLGFKTVDGVESAADLVTVQGAMPGGFVIQATETILEEQNGPGLILMRSEVTFDVVSIVTAASARGRNRDELSDLADAVIVRLLGWTWDPDTVRPIVPVGGRLLGLGGGRASWITNFRTSYRIRKQG